MGGWIDEPLEVMEADGPGLFGGGLKDFLD